MKTKIETVSFIEAVNSGRRFRMCNNNIVTEGWYEVHCEMIFLEGRETAEPLNTIHYNSQYQLEG